MNINDFKYAWKFTDEKFAKFSNFELSRIKAIDGSDFWNEIVKSDIFELSLYIQNIVAHKAPVFINDCGWGDHDTEQRTERVISRYFKNNNINNVTLLYDKNNALITECKLFCEKWSDFCYPNDSIIILLGSEFMIYYEDILYGTYRK